MNDTEKLKRTLQQNKAMHKYFTMVAESLNDAGYDMKKTLKPEIEISWTPTSVKEYLWKPIQEAMMLKDSTTELHTDQVSAVYNVLSRHLSAKLGVNVSFPSAQGD
jgi:hypothetical protein